jgi:hypothetical protein
VGLVDVRRVPGVALVPRATPGFAGRTPAAFGFGLGWGEGRSCRPGLAIFISRCPGAEASGLGSVVPWGPAGGVTDRRAI